MQVKFSLAMLLCMAVQVALFAPQAESVITCNQVTNGLLPCIGYLQGRSPLLPGCCAGVRSLAAAAATPTDRRTACRCMQTAGRSMRINFGNAATIPARCGVRISFNIGPNTDCSRVG